MVGLRVQLQDLLQYVIQQVIHTNTTQTVLRDSEQLCSGELVGLLAAPMSSMTRSDNSAKYPIICSSTVAFAGADISLIPRPDMTRSASRKADGMLDSA